MSNIPITTIQFISLNLINTNSSLTYSLTYLYSPCCAKYDIYIHDLIQKYTPFLLYLSTHMYILVTLLYTCICTLPCKPNLPTKSTKLYGYKKNTLLSYCKIPSFLVPVTYMYLLDLVAIPYPVYRIYPQNQLNYTVKYPLF